MDFSGTTWVNQHHKDKPLWIFRNMRWWGGSGTNCTISKNFAICILLQQYNHASISQQWFLQQNRLWYKTNIFSVALTINIRTQVVAYFFENELNLGLGRCWVVSHPTWMVCCTYIQHQVIHYAQCFGKKWYIVLGHLHNYRLKCKVTKYLSYKYVILSKNDCLKINILRSLKHNTSALLITRVLCYSQSSAETYTMAMYH